MEKAKKILYFDMDNVLVDFPSGICRLSEETKKVYESHLDDVPGIFSLMDPMPGAIEAVKLLSQYFDCYILSTAPWKNVSAWSEKAAWVQKYFGDDKENPFYKRLIISHHKNLNKGDYLIDDRTKNGASEFEGELIQFGSEWFPDWETIIGYLIHCAKGLQCKESIEYGKEMATDLNELSEDDISTLKYSLWHPIVLADNLVKLYPDKTFCIQRDYDYEFGNISWEKPFLFYADAEKHIENDLQRKHDEHTPHYMIDKSYIVIYPFSELQFLNRKERYDLVYPFYKELSRT